MKEFNSVIIDDEPGNIVTLSEMLKEYCPEINIRGSANNPVEGYELIRKENPDIVFLDIEMPFGNAFELLDKLSPVHFEVIFITAFNDYAVKAIKYAALDYILKPVNIGELKQAVHKAMKKLEERSLNTGISSLLANIKTENQASHKIGLPAADGLRFEDVRTIMHIQAEGSYSAIFIKGKKKELVSKSLREFEEILPTDIFCRVHHSHIININFVKKYVKGRGGYVEMEDGATIEVSTRKKNEFFEKFRH
jgi:two-component system LytT family response regulator